MLLTANKTIDGFEVSTVQLPAMRSHRLFWRLGKVAPYVLARVDMATLDWNGGFAQLAPAVLELFGRMSVEESESLVREILCATTVVKDGKSIALTTPEMIDYVFSGQLGAMYTTIAFALTTNFKDFIAGALASQASASAEPDKAKE
jgi:hypothetical protein